MKRTTRTLVPALATAALLLPLAPAASAAQAPVEAPTTSAQGQVETKAEAAAISRATVINRAKKWLTANGGKQVPYSQSKTWGGYRTDCSGYVGMALKYGKPGTNTVGLATSSYTSKIKMANLKKGDLVIDPVGSNTSRHVVIFHKWVNSNKTSYWAYEQRGGHGTDYRKLSYGLKADQYDAYRPKKY
ncbi:hypothetical protein JGS22_013590 [Streptomyces sp. P38-E01]|uniref:NlpC/P60 domain-containing protein n=1 Tax=Streptomyces tardus TaxID=2780544 RepID=A0A949JHE5_9ACTN|nr:C40 family peptidase [Streptomyces tardus]MBU7598619.1 hypothetical protein [Streptomyces tardus]